MKQQLVFATNNPHKLHEVADKIKDRLKILSLDDIGCYDDIPEIGQTMRDNASIKSHHVHQKYKVNCFADDSGLEVDALDGQPGVHSARYSGKYGDHSANMNKLLRELGDNPNRGARFRTVISLIWNDEEHFFEGTVEGTIRHERAGNAGFGYDPIFQPEGYNLTFAEMTLEQKNSISHRARAVEKLVAFLNSAG
ncbi:MAG TPA: non-canonical purine NTP diphosphatase [Mucilaginibacter sp.]|jgi:XTP/dITP diphosphohydrolase|nr:non-canonical purine NTP diphosphatase [Mucilaginibacter sp.]